MQRGVNNFHLPACTVLIYSEDRTVLIQQPPDAEVDAMFRPGVFKVYHNAMLSSRARLIIGHAVPDQEW